MRNYHLVKRSGSPRWYIAWTEGRRSRRAPTGTEDHAEALKILHLFALEHDKPAEVAAEQMPIATVLGNYFDEWASKKPSAEQARIAIDHLNTFYGLGSVASINETTNGKYRRQRLAEGANWQTINRERMVLRAAINHARKHHGLTAAPHIPSIQPDDPDASAVEPKGRPVSIAELATLYRVAKSEHIRLFILVLLGTLCRPDAARDLQIAWQCDFRHGLIHLNPKGRRQTKKHRPTVPMPSFLRKTLKGAKRKYAVEYHGEKIASVKTAWRRLRAAAGLGPDVNPYSIRHTVSRELRRRKVPGDQIGIMLGHRPANASRTDLVYAPYEPGYCAEAIKAIEQIYAQVMREVARQERAKRPVDNKATKKATKRGNADRIRASEVVGTTGIEPVTPTMSRKGQRAK